MPLHIFEHRYRVLVQALASLPDVAERQFGVIAIRAGREVGSDGVRALHGVGCTARLREVTPLPDGRFDIVVVGDTRFRLTALDSHAGTPYATGLVELLGEPDGQGRGGRDVTDLAEAVITAFDGYRSSLGLDPVDAAADDPGLLSYIVAAGALLDLVDRQALLEQPTTADRLDYELALLRRESAIIETFGAVPAVELVQQIGSLN